MSRRPRPHPAGPPPTDRPLPPGTVEREFGVPIPGVILPPEQWTPSALKQWPAEGVVNWEDLFGRRAPVVLDLGCGNGRSVLASAIARPDHDHLGVDELPVVIRYARKRARQRGLANVRFAVGDARRVVARRIADHSVAEVAVYHPQPYYRADQVHLRLITPEFLLDAHRILAADGVLVLQTDHPEYWRYIRLVVPAFFTLREHPEPWPDAPEGRTRREILARSLGLRVYRGLATPRADLDPVFARATAEALPEPQFNADRRLLHLDALERGGGTHPPGPGRDRDQE